MNHFPSLRSTFKLAWHHVNGIKFPFLISFLFMLFSFVAVELSVYAAQQEKSKLLAYFALFLSIALPLIAMTSFTRLSLRKLRGEETHWYDVFNINTYYFKTLVAFIIASLISLAIAIAIPLAIALILKVLASPAFIHTHFYDIYNLLAEIRMLILFVCASIIVFIPYVIYEQKTTPFTAWLFVVQHIKPYHLFFLGTLILLFIINILGAAFMGVGILWTLPFSNLVLAVIYESKVNNLNPDTMLNSTV